MPTAIQRREMELRNVPRFRVMEYLAEAGGSPDGEMSVHGDGWRGALIELEPVQITVITVRRDLLVIEGPDAGAVERVYAFMRRKTMRGGG